jgi:hypothetical protein
VHALSSWRCLKHVHSPSGSRKCEGLLRIALVLLVLRVLCRKFQQAKMFHTLTVHFTKLDFLGARYYDNVNDGFDGNNNATDSLCVTFNASYQLLHFGRPILTFVLGALLLAYLRVFSALCWLTMAHCCFVDESFRPLSGSSRTTVTWATTPCLRRPTMTSPTLPSSSKWPEPER